MKLLITAGPTQEPIDPVRFVSNNSSGKMGIAIAEEFAAKGYNVTLVKGPTLLHPVNPKISQILVQTAEQMYQACAQYFDNSDVIVFAAAVADYTPKHPGRIKLKKKEDEFSIEMVKTKDIALELGKRKKPGQVLVGFALETNDEIQNAKEKLKKKNLDLIVLNSLNDPGAGFQYDTNKVTLLDKSGNMTILELKSKAEVAVDIYNFVSKIIESKK
jgi:phosphopantothenoylcysteine decarboxylase/phosphopantothenate--cysteine ligase